ncbi:MAG: FtsX-like permease family protein [Bacteroidetes bacterium]|nr:MAG: FtsX-like permease family protein [Bacteroidota bacterium]
MLKNYFKIAFRNLWKHKGFSAINIMGLASGLACFILIALYVADELSYDKYNEKANRIYRIDADIVFGGNNLHLAVSPDPMGAMLKKDYPQVEEYVRFYASSGNKLIKKGNEYITETNVAHADSTLFNVFTLPAVAGDTKTALNEPNTVVVTESTAKKYFGTTDVIGKNIETNDHTKTLYKITAVIKDIPKASHFNFDFIFSMDNVDYQWGTYLSNNFQTYIVLKPGTNYKEFEKNFDQIINKYILAEAKQFMQINSMDDFRKAGNKLDYSLMPLTDIHLKSDRYPELGVNGNIQNVYIFSVIALFVLLLACVNFMNLSTARSSGRAKEIGIRKVMGSEKNALVRQFLSESILTTIISTLIAFGLVALCISWFNQVSGKELSMVSLLQLKYLPFLILLPVIVGLLAGIYPAFFLSSFNPITVLKGKVNAGFRKSTLRNVLVVCQFTISIVLIIGTIVVYRQLNYIQSKRLGFNKDQVLIINGTNALGNNAIPFKEEIKKMAGVKSGTFAGFIPISGYARNDNSFSKEAVMDSKNSLNMQVWAIDYDYLSTMGMEIKTGRNFSKEFGTDSNATIINETAAKLLGFDNPIGKKLYTFFQNAGTQKLIYREIIGVVKDFHFESMKQTIGPLSFRLEDSRWATAFKISTTNIKDLIRNVESKWKAMAPGMPFSYQFMDEGFDNMYKVEQRTGKLGLSLAIIAILIACLGLFGLATYMAEQRTKEIGVRKVLGATITNVVSMLSKDFLKLVIISAVFAFPLAWWAMDKWLQDFAFRINIGWWVFIVAGVIALLIALITVSFQAIKAALANPVKSLRTE